MENITTKIIELESGVFVIPGNTNIGVITDKNENLTEVYLVDSGSTEIDGEYILDIIKSFFAQHKSAYRIKAIINTHSHADHCGGNNFIQKQTGCEIWINRNEKSTLENSNIQGCIIFGGYAPHELRTIYYKQESTTATKTITESDIIELSENRKLSFMELSGHFFANTAVVITSADGKKTVFTGDAIFPRDEIGEHWIPFLLNPRDFCNSLDKLCLTENISFIIPSHGNFIKNNLKETAELNKIAVYETFGCILESLKNGPKTSEQIIKYIADKNELKMGLGQYHLVGSTIRSYLAVLHDEAKVKLQVKENQLFWFLNI